MAQVYTFNYTGTTQAYTFPVGLYKIQCYGAQGGNSSYGGKGGYAEGVITLLESTTLYINCGGTTSSGTGGWNGGGSTSYYGGGGATDVSLYGTQGTTSWNTTNHLYSRIIVAGAGGGGCTLGPYIGGYGGGLTGGSGAGSDYGYGGTQTSGGTYNDSSYGYGIGGFGYGATPSSTNNESVGAGGSGWYGGGCGGYHNNNGSGGGGSSYVYTESTKNNYPNGCLLNENYYLTDTVISSNINSGNGYCIITQISNMEYIDCNGDTLYCVPGDIVEINTIYKTIIDNNIYYFNKYEIPKEYVKIINNNGPNITIEILNTYDTINILTIKALFVLYDRFNTNFYKDSIPQDLFDFNKLLELEE